MTWQKSHLLVQVVHSNLHIYIVTCEYAATEPFLTMSAVVPWLPVESVMAVSEKMKTDWTA